MRSRDGGASWQELNEGLYPGGRAGRAGASVLSSGIVPCSCVSPRPRRNQPLAGVGRQQAGACTLNPRLPRLGADIHSCRINPHDPSHWLAVTGRGLYVTRDAGASQLRCLGACCTTRRPSPHLCAPAHRGAARPPSLSLRPRRCPPRRPAGASWRPQGSWSGLYTVGLAWNPARAGEVIITAGDRPPAIGVHAFLSQVRVEGRRVCAHSGQHGR
jgi:hypothetical protein